MKQEFPPIFPPGFHPISVEQLEEICVGKFNGSETRKQILDGLKEVLYRLDSVGIKADVWINGSFTTLKENPEDVDIAVKIDHTYLEQGTPEQIETLKWIEGNLKGSHKCDSYIIHLFPQDDPRAVLNEYNLAMWIRQFGFSRKDEYKGLAVIQTGIS
jgi:hypothetical protein